MSASLTLLARPTVPLFAGSLLVSYDFSNDRSNVNQLYWKVFPGSYNSITSAFQSLNIKLQMSLRLYRSIIEILTGFDVDCTCAGFDGKQMSPNPRGTTAIVRHTNVIDLSRRSPYYLAKAALATLVV